MSGYKVEAIGIGVQLHPSAGRAVWVQADWSVPQTTAAYWTAVAWGQAPQTPRLVWTTQTLPTEAVAGQVAAQIAAYRGRWTVFVDGRGGPAGPRLGWDRALNRAQQAYCIEYDPNALGLDGTETPALYRDMQAMQYWWLDPHRVWPAGALAYRPVGTPLPAQLDGYDVRAVRRPDHQPAADQAARRLRDGAGVDYAEAAMLSMQALAGALGRHRIVASLGPTDRVLHPYDDPFARDGGPTPWVGTR